jgi:hypothetical protein
MGENDQEHAVGGGHDQDPDLTLDAEVQDDTFTLLLTLRISRFQQPVYAFHMPVVGQDRAAQLEARLRDAEEVIDKMKPILVATKRDVKEIKARPSDAAYISLGSTTAAQHGQFITWNVTKLLKASHFELAADQQTITILRRGVYQLSVRIFVSAGQNAYVALQVNGSNLALAYSYSSGHSVSYQLHEVLQLAAGATVQVYNGTGNQTSNGDAYNRFSAVLLEEL